MFLYGKTSRKLVHEDLVSLRDWENYVLLDRLPHELGYTPEPCVEDIEGIKTMKKWAEDKQNKEQRRLESKKRMRDGMRAAGG